MFYPEELIEEIREKNNIVDVVNGYLSLQKKGGNYWACCPFHNENTPSFSVSENKQMYHCFGCGESGNVITFVMKYENFSFREAVKLLADRAGVELPKEEFSKEQREKETKRARLLDVNKQAAKFFYYQLRSPHGQIGYQYLKKRELSDETMHHFGLGYAGKNGAELVQYLRSKGFEDEIIKEAGLANFSERHGLVSQFWNRVMYPIQDGNHRVIGFGGRVMGDGEPKYLNSPETPIFDKRRNLYGLNFARTARAGNMIICEGYMDVIAMHQAGFTQAVASLGTAFTVEQARLLKRYTDNVLLAYDSDGAGVKAALRGIGILREVGLTGKVINMRPHKDPDEFMKALGKEAFQERIDQAENSFFFEIRILAEQFDMNDPEAKTNFHREIARKLCNFEEEIERENYLRAIAEKYFINVDNLKKLVVSYASQTGLAKPIERPKSTVSEKKNPQEMELQSQRLLLSWLAEKPELYEKIKKYISPNDFTDALYQTVAEQLFEGLEEGKVRAAGIVSMFTEEEEQSRAAEIFHATLPEMESEKERERAIKDLVIAVKKNSYERDAASMGTDVGALGRVIEGKKALEELSKIHISLT